MSNKYLLYIGVGAANDECYAVNLALQGRNLLGQIIRAYHPEYFSNNNDRCLVLGYGDGDEKFLLHLRPQAYKYLESSITGKERFKAVVRIYDSTKNQQKVIKDLRWIEGRLDKLGSLLDR